MAYDSKADDPAFKLRNTQMTRPLHHPLGKDVLRLMARLMQLHVETHPERVARVFGVTGRYIRQQWHAHAVSEMATTQEALKMLRTYLARTDEVCNGKERRTEGRRTLARSLES